MTFLFGRQFDAYHSGDPDQPAIHPPPLNKKTYLFSRVWPFLILIYIDIYHNKKYFFRPRVSIFFLNGIFSARGL